jgi:hypothetical protein
VRIKIPGARALASFHTVCKNFATSLAPENKPISRRAIRLRRTQ